jgi:hypothetical protein
MKENHNKFFFYETLLELIKERNTHLEGKRKEQQERTNIKPRITPKSTKTRTHK